MRQSRRSTARTGEPSSSASRHIAISSLSSACRSPMILLNDLVAMSVCGHVRHVQDGRQVQPITLPMPQRVVRLQHFDVADRLVHRAQAELRQVLAHLFGDEFEKRLDKLRLAGEPLT